MIKTIIFDIGDVLVSADWKQFCIEKGCSKEMAERIQEATFEGGYWKEFDRGIWSEEELLAQFVKADASIEQELRRIWKNIRGFCKRQEYAIPWICSLKERGFQVLVLSNLPKKVHEECIDALDFLEIVDGGVLSYQEQLIKPEPIIYQRLIDRYQLTPKEAVFLDDRLENIEAAQKMGMQGIHVRGHQQAKDALEIKIII